MATHEQVEVFKRDQEKELFENYDLISLSSVPKDPDNLDGEWLLEAGEPRNSSHPTPAAFRTQENIRIPVRKFAEDEIVPLARFSINSWLASMFPKSPPIGSCKGGHRIRRGIKPGTLTGIVLLEKTGELAALSAAHVLGLKKGKDVICRTGVPKKIGVTCHHAVTLTVEAALSTVEDQSSKGSACFSPIPSHGAAKVGHTAFFCGSVTRGIRNVVAVDASFTTKSGDFFTDQIRTAVIGDESDSGALLAHSEEPDPVAIGMAVYKGRVLHPDLGIYTGTSTYYNKITSIFSTLDLSSFV